MTLDDLMNLPLHSHKEINNQLTVTRVPGGWLYQTIVMVTVLNTGYGTTTKKSLPPQVTFVPEPVI